MKKRILSFLLTAIMIITMMPAFSAPAFAAPTQAELLLLDEVFDAMENEVYVSTASNGNPVAIIPNKDDCYSYNYFGTVFFKLMYIDSQGYVGESYNLTTDFFVQAEKNDNVITLRFRNISYEDIEIAVTIEEGVATQVDIASTADSYLPFSGLTYKRSYGLFVSGKPVTQDNAADILNDGTVSCVLDNNGNPVLTLNNATVPYGHSFQSNSNTIASSCVEWFKPLTISLQGTNNFTSGNFDCNALYGFTTANYDFIRKDMNPNLSINGTGKLNMNLVERLIANTAGSLNACGIKVEKGDLVISESEIYMHFDLDKNANNSFIYGMFSNEGSISIKHSAKVTAELLGKFGFIVPMLAKSVAIDESELYITIDNINSQTTYLAPNDKLVISDKSYVSLKYAAAVRPGADLGVMLDEVDIDIADTLPITNAITDGGTLVTSSSDLSDCSCLVPNDYTLPLEIGTLTKYIVNTVPVADKATKNGYIDIPAKSLPGETVTLTVLPNSGYQLKADTLKATYNDGENKSCALTQDANDKTKYTFTMPGYEVTVAAEFEIEHTHNFTGDYEEYDTDNHKWAKKCSCGEYDTDNSLIGVEIPKAKTGIIYDGTNKMCFANDYSDYCTIENDKAVNAGMYLAKCTLKDGYIWADGTKEVKTIEWAIAPQILQDATAKDAEYTGSKVTPVLTFRVNDLVLGTDYTIGEWSGNLIDPGTYTATVTFIGNYQGSAKVTFSILKDPNEQFIVKFDLNNGNINGPKPQIVDMGMKASEPEAPTCEEVIFDGWYTDKECTDGNEYDFDSEVTKDLILYAKWKPATSPDPEPDPDPEPEPEPKPVEVYYAPLVADLKANEEGVIEWKAGDSLPLEAVRLLVEKPELSLEFTFTYEGAEHTIFIPAGAFEQYYDVTIPWYGPAWLIERFEKPQKDVIEYIIVKDDTLNALAEKFKCTVEEILALNPYINDKHWIYPNNKLLIPVQK